MFNWIKKKTLSLEKPKSLGQLGEEFGQSEYRRRGYKILAANFFNRKGLRFGEIDFIAKDKEGISAADCLFFRPLLR